MAKMFVPRLDGLHPLNTAPALLEQANQCIPVSNQRRIGCARQSMLPSQAGQESFVLMPQLLFDASNRLRMAWSFSSLLKQRLDTGQGVFDHYVRRGLDALSAASFQVNRTNLVTQDHALRFGAGTA